MSVLDDRKSRITSDFLPSGLTPQHPLPSWKQTATRNTERRGGPSTTPRWPARSDGFPLRAANRLTSGSAPSSPPRWPSPESPGDPTLPARAPQLPIRHHQRGSLRHLELLRESPPPPPPSEQFAAVGASAGPVSDPATGGGDQGKRDQGRV